MKLDYNSYEEFVQHNIGERKAIFEIGSGSSSILGGLTKEFIDGQFDELIGFLFSNSEFLLNCGLEKKDKFEYMGFVDSFIAGLKNNPALFQKHITNNLKKSGRYDTLYDLNIKPRDNEHFIFNLYENKMSSNIKNKYLEMKKVAEF